MKDRLSTKNSLLYMMKYINNKSKEYVPLENDNHRKTERYDDKY